MEYVLIFWIVGALFTNGLNDSDTALRIIVTILFWPYVLGMIIRKCITGE